MNLARLALAIATGAIPLTASFYTYDRLSGASAFKRSGYAALAGLGAGVLASLASMQLLNIDMPYPVMSLNSESQTKINGLPDTWSAGVLPSNLGVPVNVYSKQPIVTEVGHSFGAM